MSLLCVCPLCSSGVEFATLPAASLHCLLRLAAVYASSQHTNVPALYNVDENVRGVFGEHLIGAISTVRRRLSIAGVSRIRPEWFGYDKAHLVECTIGIDANSM